jgi:hypothetical protein
MRIATDGETETLTDDGKNPAAKAFGKKPTSTKWPAVQAQSATGSGSWQAAPASWTAATSSADDAPRRAEAKSSAESAEPA